MGKCHVAGCANVQQPTSGSKKKISFHNVPKDYRKIVWLEFAKLSENVKSPRICSAHFKKECFERDLKSELLNIPPKSILKPDAIPTIYTINEGDIYEDESTTECDDSYQQNIKTKTLETEFAKKSVSYQPMESITINDKEYCCQDIKIELVEEEREEKTVSLQQYNELKRQLEKERNEKNILIEQNNELKRRIFKAESDIRYLGKTRTAMDTNNELKVMLSPFLSPTEMDLFLENKRKVVWTQGELSTTFKIKDCDVKTKKRKNNE